MLRSLPAPADHILAFRIDGNVSQEEMHTVLESFKAKQAKHSRVSVYEEIVTLGGIEFRGIIEKLKMMHDVGLSGIEKLALVTDKQWIKTLAELEDKLLRDTAIKHFTLEDKAQAMAFLND